MILRTPLKRLSFLIIAVNLLLGCKQQKPKFFDVWQSVVKRADEVRLAGDIESPVLQDDFSRLFVGHGRKTMKHPDWNVVTIEDGYYAAMPTNQEQAWQGFFLIRTSNQKKNILLQAPHGYFDRGTSKIALRLFEEGFGEALAMNTIKRTAFDIAHEPRSSFNQFTRSFIETRSYPIVVQLHGFAVEKRKQPVAQAALMIVSAGTNNPEEYHSLIVARLRNQFGQNILLYPRDVLELGGTKNIQGQLVRRMKKGHFLHIEMSWEMRRRMLQNKETRNAFVAAVGGA